MIFSFVRAKPSRWMFSIIQILPLPVIIISPINNFTLPLPLPLPISLPTTARRPRRRTPFPLAIDSQPISPNNIIIIIPTTRRRLLIAAISLRHAVPPRSAPGHELIEPRPREPPIGLRPLCIPGRNSLHFHPLINHRLRILLLRPSLKLIPDPLIMPQLLITNTRHEFLPREFEIAFFDQHFQIRRGGVVVEETRYCDGLFALGGALGVYGSDALVDLAC